MTAWEVIAVGVSGGSTRTALPRTRVLGGRSHGVAPGHGRGGRRAGAGGRKVRDGPGSATVTLQWGTVMRQHAGPFDDEVCQRWTERSLSQFCSRSRLGSSGGPEPMLCEPTA